MKFGILNKGFKRLSNFYKDSEGYTEDWESEYGEGPIEAEEWHYGDISNEDFVKGEVVMAAMGYDLESLSNEEKIKILEKYPNFLELTPQLNVAGQWIHTTQHLDLWTIQYALETISSSPRELCVSDANNALFWDEISTERMFAVVFEGVCKVLWNADVYSYFNRFEDKLLKHPYYEPTHINEMTEGWLVPSESHAVGILVNWEEIEKWYDANTVQQIMKRTSEALGIPIFERSDLGDTQTLIDISISSEEDTANYTCDL